MEEQLISFETAKLAKEKGLPQDNFYFEDYEAGVPFYGLDNELNKGDEDRFGQCKSISQSLLQKWLREVHNIHFEIKPIFDVKDNLKPYHISVIKNPSGKDFEYEIVGSLDTYEEALEIGLQEALKLIK